MQKLPLEIVIGNTVEIGDAKRADPGGGKIERDRAPEAAGTDNEHARGSESGLTRNPDLVELEVPAVTCKFGRSKAGRRIGHYGEREPQGRASQMKLRP